MISLLKKPSAWIPIAIPLAFFAYLVIYISLFGIVPEADGVCIGTCRRDDEGTGAHLFQLWLLLEPFMLGFFAVKYLPLARKETLQILALQIVAALLPISVVFSLGL